MHELTLIRTVNRIEQQRLAEVHPRIHWYEHWKRGLPWKQ
jgi:hypothetical protein